MSLLSKAQLKEFIKENNITSVAGIQSTLKELFKDVLEEMLQAELDTTLGYEKYDVKNKQYLWN